mmetsp:Transcript_44142/g.80604  ORF Transcript_44142/g.80604 Transcript_44142/m.80604 type:complete len:86 (+) Transcript_44142:1006-1263(+)
MQLPQFWNGHILRFLRDAEGRTLLVSLARILGGLLCILKERPLETSMLHMRDQGLRKEVRWKQRFEGAMVGIAEGWAQLIFVVDG